MFRFVGEGSFFNAHRKLVAYVSEPLKAKMLAHDGAALLFEVDKATFGRFLEWCYTGDYNAAKVQHLYEIDSEDEDASDEEAGELNPAGEADGTTGLGWTAALERTEALMVEDSFQDANDEIPITVANDEEMGEDETDEDDEDDEVDRLANVKWRSADTTSMLQGLLDDPFGYPISHATTRIISTSSFFSAGDYANSLDRTPELFTQVQLHILATRYRVRGLELLSFQRLSGALKGFKTGRCLSTLQSFAGLIKHVYGYTANPKHS
ncbi:hypothetical protein LTR09_000011 [Extremus antarcticus]|uniref:BTB domain-containing protein n=1 Tax=Extremus antarcticus TaxID=702011 RepID=A0AAJ0GIU3_9PEZI|nr:hypothetical protein LTR09_000011 [Extremus antarcticus]